MRNVESIFSVGEWIFYRRTSYVRRRYGDHVFSRKLVLSSHKALVAAAHNSSLYWVISLDDLGVRFV